MPIDLQKGTKSLGTSVNGVPMPLAGEGIGARKLMIFGEIATGKTRGLADLVEAGERLLVASTEQGGNGLLSLASELKRRGLGTLFSTNVRSVDLKNYKQVFEFFAMDKGEDGRYHPRLYSHYPEFREWGPTVLVWEGFRNFQISQIDEKILGESGMSLPEGKTARYDYWAELKKMSLRVHDDFLSCSDPDSPWAHVLTVHEDEDWLHDDKGAKVKLLGIKPAIQGKASESVKEAYDLILRSFIELVPDPPRAKKKVYKYEVIKGRGLEGYLETEFPADMGRCWKALGDVLKEQSELKGAK